MDFGDERLGGCLAQVADFLTAKPYCDAGVLATLNDRPQTDQPGLAAASPATEQQFRDLGIVKELKRLVLFAAECQLDHLRP